MQKKLSTFLHFSSLTISKSFSLKETNTKYPNEPHEITLTNLELFLKSYYFVVFGGFLFARLKLFLKFIVPVYLSPVVTFTSTSATEELAPR